MKTSHMFLLLGLVLTLTLHSDANPFGINAISCCFKFFNHKIPPQDALKVKKTDSRCLHQGFIVTTPKNLRLCVREHPSKNI